MQLLLMPSVLLLLLHKVEEMTNYLDMSSPLKRGVVLSSEALLFFEFTPFTGPLSLLDFYALNIQVAG